MLVSHLPKVAFWNPWLDAYYHWVTFFYDTDPAFKNGYILHPREIPLKATPICSIPVAPQVDQIPPVNGLCFSSPNGFVVGGDVSIVITLNNTDFTGLAKVVWVEEQDNHFFVGVHFNDQEGSYSIRMAEQVCHIAHYRTDVLKREGRELTEEEAALEWVERYASKFPKDF